MTYKNICSKKVYKSNGVDKVKWLNCGTLRINDDGKQFIELNVLPNETLYVFDQKKKEETHDDTDVNF